MVGRVNSSRPVPLSPSRPSLWPFRLVAQLGLAVGVSFVAALFVLSLLRPSLALLRGLLYFGLLPSVKATVAPAVILILVSLGTCGYAGWRLWTRRKGGLVFSSLLVASVLVADLLVMAFILPGVMDPLTDLLSQNQASDFGFVMGLVAVIPLTVAVLIFRLRSWRWIGAGYAALGLILAYLATDDARRGAPLAFEQISPVFPGAEASYNVLMRYGKNHPSGKKFREPQRIFHNNRFVKDSDAAEWGVWIEHSRAAIEADWAELVPVRAWIDELNGFDRISDLMPADVRAEIITFAPFRSYANHACQIAGLQALAGHGDDAIATLLPLLQVSRKLEPSSRSLVRAMIARVMQERGLTAVQFVLNRTTVSPGMRVRLADSLRLGVGGETGVRHLLSTESTFFSAASGDRSLGDFIPLERRPELVRRSLNVASPFVYNPHRTANLHREFAESIQDIAARRDMVALKQAERAFAAVHADPKFKNFMGDFIVGATVPAYQKVVETYWRIEDSRTSLLTRLATESRTAGHDAAPARGADIVATAN